LGARPTFPDGVDPSPRNVRAGILAYAAGDALGVPWEGKTPDEVRWETLEELPARGDWPRGATSDDTDQLLLVARYLIEANGQVDERGFLTRLAKALPGIRGVGPTTSAAVRRFVQTGEAHATEGSSIGAAMRALPFGWATPVAAVEQRRGLTVRLSQATHGAPAAIMSACVVATMAAWAIAHHPIEAVVTAGLREADDLARLYALDSAILQPLHRPPTATGNRTSSRRHLTRSQPWRASCMCCEKPPPSRLPSSAQSHWGATLTPRRPSSEASSVVSSKI
jgi:ADP-ribosylglycohydrolase